MPQGSNSNPIKLGIIGSGLAVKYLHAPAIKKLSGKYEIVVSCAHTEESAKEGAKLAKNELNSPNCSWTTDYREVLANPEVEAVLLSLPIYLNAQFMLESAQAGKHIIAEKPLAANLPEAQQLVSELSKFDQLVIEIAENYHYRADFLKAKEWLKAGRIGEPFLIEMQSRFFVDSSKGFAATPWRYSEQFRGGLVMDGGVHYAAALRDLGGEVEHLQAYVKTAHPDQNQIDTLLLNLRFQGGMVGNLLYSGALQTRETTALHGLIYGSKGTIELSNGRVVLTEGSAQKAQVVEEYEVADFDGGYEGEFSNFYEAVRNGAKVVSTAEEALKDMAVISAALDSAESGKTVQL